MERDRLLRFVLDPEGKVRPDIGLCLPGRGMWLSADRNVLNKAVARNLFAKAARAPARVEADLAGQVESLLVRRALDTLGLARRAGQAIVGFEQVRICLRSSRAALLLAAADAAADGREKLRRLAPHLPLITGFSRVELGSALGRESLVHVAIAPGALAERLLKDAERLAGFRPNMVERPVAARPLHET
ncbi:MAG: RNA-binding protein, partial [Geminicoccaceae bacterium]